MATTTDDDWTTAPYAEWLENCIKGLVERDPICITMAIVDADGFVETSFYGATSDELTVIINALNDELKFRWIKDYKEEILTILNDEDDDVEDGNDGEADD